MDFKTCLILLTGCLYASFCHSELKDPTKPVFYSPKTVITSRSANALQLTSIWVSDLFKRVTINGVTAKQGELILSNIRIVEILNDSVVIRQNGKTRKLYLLTHASNLSKTAFK